MAAAVEVVKAARGGSGLDILVAVSAQLADHANSRHGSESLKTCPTAHSTKFQLV